MVAAAGLAVGIALLLVATWQDNRTAALVAAATTLVLAITMLERHVAIPKLPGLIRLGDMSYSIYLVHVPLQMAVLLLCDGVLGGTRAFAQHPLTLPVYLLVVIILADQTYRHFERPVGAWLRQRLRA